MTKEQDFPFKAEVVFAIGKYGNHAILSNSPQLDPILEWEWGSVGGEWDFISNSANIPDDPGVYRIRGEVTLELESDGWESVLPPSHYHLFTPDGDPELIFEEVLS